MEPLTRLLQLGLLLHRLLLMPLLPRLLSPHSVGLVLHRLLLLLRRGHSLFPLWFEAPPLNPRPSLDLASRFRETDELLTIALSLPYLKPKWPVSWIKNNILFTAISGEHERFSLSLVVGLLLLELA